MSGLLALLDDIAALTKLAAVQVDDIAAQAGKVGVKVAGSVIDDAAKAGAKSAGVVIDDAAVTPKYVQGLPAARELPIVWKIARGSLFNKLVLILPVAMALNIFAPWALDASRGNAQFKTGNRMQGRQRTKTNSHTVNSLSNMGPATAQRAKSAGCASLLPERSCATTQP